MPTLHPRLKRGDPIERLAPTKFIRRTLGELGITTVRELLALAPRTLSEMKGVGPRRADVLRSLIDLAREEMRAGEPAPAPPPRPPWRREAPRDLASRIEAQGVDLTRPWRELLTRLPVRAERALSAAGLVTLGGVAVAFANYHPSGAIVVEAPPKPPEAPRVVARDRRPWRSVLTGLSVRVESAIEAEGIETMQELVAGVLAGRFEHRRNFGRTSRRELEQELVKRGLYDAPPPPAPVPRGVSPRLRAIHGAGRRSCRDVYDHLETIARHGIEFYWWGSRDPIATPGALVARTLASLDPADRELVAGWMRGDWTVGAPGGEQGADAERPHPRLGACSDRMRRRFGPVARRIAARLLFAVEVRGPLLHRSVVESLLPGAALPDAGLALTLAGAEEYRRWNDFLSSLPSARLDALVLALRRLVVERRQKGAPIDRLRARALSGFDVDLTQDALLALLATSLPVEVKGGRVVAGKRAR